MSREGSLGLLSPSRPYHGGADAPEDQWQFLKMHEQYDSRAHGDLQSPVRTIPHDHQQGPMRYRGVSDGTESRWPWRRATSRRRSSRCLVTTGKPTQRVQKPRSRCGPTAPSTESKKNIETDSSALENLKNS